MKTLTLENSAAVARALKRATGEGYLELTRNGKPIAYVLPTAFYDEEDIGYMTDPEFWKAEKRSRSKPTTKSRNGRSAA